MDSTLLNPATPVYASALARPGVAQSSTTGRPGAGVQGLSEFRDLLAVMLLGMSTPGGSEGGLSGIGTNQMIAPLVLTLLEKLLANQVAEQEPVEDSLAVSQADQPKPKGMPIDGYLTQSSRSGHIALDFGARVGTPVQATMDGTVVYAGWNDEGYGKLVIVENGPFRTYYAHLSKIPVEVGQAVAAGSVVGLSGNTGNSTGPHLHYEVRKNGQQIDPSSFTLPA